MIPEVIFLSVFQQDLNLSIIACSVIDLVFIIMSMLTIICRVGLFCITTLCSGAGISTIGSTCHETRSKQLSR